MATSSPVSTDRIRDLLRSRDVRFGDYNEGELAYLTPNAAFFWNATNPQILQLRAQWRGIARTPEQFGELAREVATAIQRARVRRHTWLRSKMARSTA